ncbi:aminoglycoside N(3)-acetyltransferase [Pseudalkalibacillus berkeleyi]|uniref:Aminoglycoside N(3)-acetyltransferase n=1 Tax=Pseudalkalibacillus berkeleyi TaxID=1069813 RepID=A0ABS9GWV4_9BACL|nr:AAC(3) family N-acetyltransferase [Pseudalkalibacillus berkeleyi]MCF6136155.1 AAC(3) family N-acetyltransferase [Pseudalkalibacillus berkeleyi]
MEKQLIEQTDTPRTTESLRKDLQLLGVKPGMTLIVHSSLKSIGWVCGDSQAVIDALMDAVTADGTLILPAHSAALSDPADWINPPVPENWWETIRKTMPAFDPKKTPTRGLGVIAERFRSYPEVLRSYHPTMSFSAWGKKAAYVTNGHTLDDGLGEQSPLGKAYELDADVLFLGTDFDTHTSFHLSEHRSSVRKAISKGAPIIENGKRVWKNFLEIDYDDEQFGEVGKAFESEFPVYGGKVGSASCKLFKMRSSVDFGVKWMKENIKEG